MQSDEFGKLESKLLSGGWVKDADGTWTAPKRKDILGALETNGAKPTATRALDKGVAKHKGSESGLEICVTCIALRKRLLDGHDAIAFSMKPLTDAIAATLGLDDADQALTWEYSQQKTDGEQGVLVKIETRGSADGKT